MGDTPTPTRKGPTSEKPLVNENPEPRPDPTTLEDAIKALHDARDEVQRAQKHNERLAASVKEQTATIEKLSKKPAAPPPAATNNDALIPDEDYEGPSIKEIYLAIVTGLFTQNVPTSDEMTRRTADSALGYSEVFFHRAIRRNSFRKRGPKQESR